MWANKIVITISGFVAAIFIPFVWISTFLIGLLAVVTLDLILLPLNTVWFILFKMPLLATSWLWSKYRYIRFIIAIIGVPWAVLGSLFVSLVPSMGDMDLRRRKLNLCWGWPFSLGIRNLYEGNEMDDEDFIISLISNIEAPMIRAGSRHMRRSGFSKTELERVQEDLVLARSDLAESKIEIDKYINSLSPSSDKDNFVPAFEHWWQKIENQGSNLEDALNDYISQFNLVPREDVGNLDQSKIARVKLKILESGGMSFDNVEDSKMLESYKMSLRIRAVSTRLS